MQTFSSLLLVQHYAIQAISSSSVFRLKVNGRGAGGSLAMVDDPGILANVNDLGVLVDEGLQADSYRKDCQDKM